MKILYVITWCVSSVVTIPCTHMNKPNEFGVTYGLNTACTVLHRTVTTDCNHTKTFYDRDSATSFYKSALQQRDLLIIKIDSIK